MHSPRDHRVGIAPAAVIYQAAHPPPSFISLYPAAPLPSNAGDSRYAGEMIAAWAGRYLPLPEAPTPSRQPAGAIDNRVTARTAAGEFRTEIFANGFSLVADEPKEYGGNDEGPSPYDYLQAALGACTGMTLHMYARRKGWPLAETVVRLSHQKINAEDCRDCDDKKSRIDLFARELELKGELDGAQRQTLLEIAGQCPVHRTLEGEVRVETTLRHS